MIINLKQTEIELALRAYVVAQGISLHGKDLSISFTAGRREAGITAEISIDDVEIPGYTTITAEPVVMSKPTLIALSPAIANVFKEPAEEIPAVEEAQPEAQEEAMPEAEEPVVETKQTVSLFG